MPANPVPDDENAQVHRLLFLQNSSVFESYGGIEYYQDDFLHLAAEAYSGERICAVVPKRSSRFSLEPRPYATRVVEYSSNRWVQKLQNRFSRRYLQEAERAARELNPTLVVVGHIALAPQAYLLHRATGLPYVVIAYGIEMWGDLWPQDALALKHSDGILSISHWTKRILIENGVGEEHIAVIQPMLPPDFEDIDLPQRERSPKEPLRLLTVSRLDATEQYKGHDHVLEALHRLRKTEPKTKFEYLIQGDGTDRRRLESLVRELELQDIVEFRGAVKSRDDLEAAYRDADLFVMPSRFGRWEGRWRGEGFGIVYLEAAAFGLPLVAYDCGGATDIIRNGENGMLVDPDNVAELARTLLRLHGDRKHVRQMGDEAYRRVMGQFTRNPIRQQLVSALEPFLPGRKKEAEPEEEPKAEIELGLELEPKKSER